MRTKKEKIALYSLLMLSIAAFVAIFSLNPIAQNSIYHSFADQRTLFGIKNFGNVLSNIPFLIVGLLGLFSIFKNKTALLAPIKIAYLTFFTGVSLVALGSGYYHLWPDNNTLVWDRLPMTIAFMALFAIIIGEFISQKLAIKLLWLLIGIGISSVFYWSYTESLAKGDLRLYVLVQFLPMLLIPIILLIFKPTFTHSHGYWSLLAAYLLAKIFEFFDQSIYQSIPFISGHSIKHLFAALGIYFLLRAYNNRDAVDRLS